VSAPPAIALLVRNGSHQLEPAIEGLLAQTPPPVICVLDDHSHDATPHVLAQLARRHPEVQVRRTDARVGPVEACRRSALLVRELHPDAELFAWVCSDDQPGADWLGPLVGALRRRRERVGALPKGPGSPLAMRDVTDPSRRAALALAHEWPPLPTGIVFRLDAVLAAGVLRSMANPACVLGAELALSGELVTIEHVHYYRGPSMRGGLTEAYPNGIPVAAVLPPRAAALLSLSRHHRMGGEVLRQKLSRELQAARRRLGRLRVAAASAPGLRLDGVDRRFD
jgi:glycosyltransferase involved in cell wall biosynthesis